MAGIKEYLSHLRDVAQRVETDLLRVIQSIFQSNEIIDIIESVNLYPRGLRYYIFSAYDIDAPGLPQRDRPNPIIVDLGQYVISDLVGNVVITQSGGINYSGLNGTYTVSLADIIAAGSSGYRYASARNNVGTLRIMLAKIVGDNLTIDYVAETQAGGTSPGINTNIVIDSVTFQVSELKPGPAQADKSNIIVVGEWKLTN